MKKKILGITLVAILFAVFYAFSWLITCGIIYLICLCFDLAFKWSIATGIWLILCLAKTVFKHNTTVKK